MEASRTRWRMDLLQPGKRAADDEENVFGVDGGGGFLTPLSEVHHGLNLAGDIVRGPRRHLGFLHQLEEIGLNSAPAHVPSGRIGGGGNLVDLIDVDDPVLRARHIAPGQAHEIAHHVLDIRAHVARLGELGRVGFDERDPDQVGGFADQKRLADARGSNEDDVLLGVIRGFLAIERQPHVVVVVAKGHAEHFLGFVLSDHKSIEVIFDVLGFVIETKRLEVGLGFGVAAFRAPGFDRGRFAVMLEVLSHQVRELPLKLLGGGWTIPKRFVHILAKLPGGKSPVHSCYPTSLLQ